MPLKFVSGLKTYVADDYKVPIIEEAPPVTTKASALGSSSKRDNGRVTGRPQILRAVWGC